MESPFTMVVLIVAICVIGGIVRARMGLPERRGRRFGARWEAAAADADPALREENARLRDELAMLKRRVANLERIATDGSATLDREIEALRDRT